MKHLIIATILTFLSAGPISMAADNDSPSWESQADFAIRRMSNGVPETTADELAADLLQDLYVHRQFAEETGDLETFELRRRFVVNALTNRLTAIYGNYLRTPKNDTIKKLRLFKLLMELGKSGDPVSAQAFIHGLQDPEPSVRRIAIAVIHRVQPWKAKLLRNQISETLMNEMENVLKRFFVVKDPSASTLDRQLAENYLATNALFMADLFNAEFSFDIRQPRLVTEMVVYSGIAGEYPRLVQPLFAALASQPKVDPKLVIWFGRQYFDWYKSLKKSKRDAERVSNALSVLNTYWDRFEAAGVFEVEPMGSHFKKEMEKARKDERLKIVKFERLDCGSILTRK